MLVLTLDREGYFGGRQWLDVNEAYAELGRMTRATLARIGRLWGAGRALEASGRSKTLRTVRKLGNAWIQTVEAHRSGWPHVNLLVWCPELAAELRAEQADRLEDPEIANALADARAAWQAKEPVSQSVRQLARKASLASGPLLDIIERSGWGKQSTAEAARDIEAAIGYAVKLAALHGQSVGELAKITQLPLNAPIRFRRYRTGKGFLPPREFDEQITGVLIRRRVAAEGDWEIQAVNAPKDQTTWPAIELAIIAEQKLILEEERIRSRSRGRLAPMPPVRYAHDGVLEGHVETSEVSRALERQALDRTG